MPQSWIEPSRLAPRDPDAEPGFGDDDFGGPEQGPNEGDDDPAGEGDFPVPTDSDTKTD